MKNLDVESQKNLMEVIHISGNIFLTGALFFLIYFFIFDMLALWSWSSGIVLIICGFIVKLLNKKLAVKQLYIASFILVIINIILYN